MRYLLTKNEIAMYRKLAGPGVPPQRKSETVFNCKAINLLSWCSIYTVFIHCWHYYGSPTNEV